MMISFAIDVMMIIFAILIKWLFYTVHGDRYIYFFFIDDDNDNDK